MDIAAISTLLPPGMSWSVALLLVAVSFFTSALTAAFGIGGGVAMLGALAGTAPTNAIIAVHGVVQLGSNVGRSFIQRRSALWPLVWRFAIGSLIGAVLGALVFTALPERVLLGLLGLFILAMVYVPKPQIPGLAHAGVVFGGVIGTFVTMFVGATGPFVQALLLPLTKDRKELIATHAMCMSVQHGLKVLVFSALGFAFWSWLPLLVLMIGSGFLGTMFGTALLERLPERLFQTGLKIILTLIALDLLRQALGLPLPFR